VQNVGLVVIDEIHLLGEDRGPVLEVIVSRMRYISSQTQSPVRFVGMSTAIANAQDVADWLGAKDGGVFNFHPSVRPVPMQVHIQGYEGQFYCPRMAIMNKPTFAAIQDYSKDKPVIVFVSSRRQTRLTALDLIQLGAQTENPRQFVRADEEELRQAVSRIKDPNLRHTISFGIGLHHAGLCEGDRNLVENLFEQCKIQVLVSTSTLAWGVNLPAHLVVIKGTEFYDAPSKRYVDFPITDVLQMMGRAGRPQFDTVGIAVVMVHAPKKAFYKRFLYEPFPVESSLSDALHNHINAEIVSGTIKTKAHAVDYLTWTYFFRRLLCNPAYYHLEDTSHEGISAYLASLVQRTLEDLEDTECIEVEEDQINATTLGRITAYYYLDHTTAHMFASNVANLVDQQSVLDVLSKATEFAELPVRHNEEHLNADLAKQVQFGGMGGAMESPHTKTSLLIQAHIGKVPMPIADYNTDLRSVLEQTGRVLQALVDVTADAGYLDAALQVMRLSQSMTACLFADQSSLLTLPNVTERVARNLNDIGISALRQLVDMSREDVVGVLRKCGVVGAHAAGAQQLLQQLPSIRFSAVIAGDGGKVKGGAGGKGSVFEMEAGGEGEMVMRIEQTNRAKRGSAAYVPKSNNLPSKARSEGWWAVVGCKETDELLALKRLSIRRDSTSTVLSFLAPEDPGHATLTAYIISDCYVGLDVEHDVPLLLHPTS
jgi:activating signal cointegrator complex subunit 3